MKLLLLLLIVRVTHVASYEPAYQCSCENPQGPHEPLRDDEVLMDEELKVYPLDFDSSVKVALPLIPPGWYHIELHVQEEIDAESCPKTNVEYIRHLHSKIHYEVKSNDCQKCQKDGYYATFNYVFTGCYHINIGINYKRKYKSKPTFISTNYTKSTLSKIHDDIRILPPKLIENGSHEFTFQVPTSHFSKPPDISTKLYRLFDNCLFSSLIEEGNVPRYNTSCVSSNITWNCSWRKNKYFDLVCNYHALDPGYYAIDFEILHDTRCNPDSYWAAAIPAYTCSRGCSKFEISSTFKNDLQCQLPINYHFSDLEIRKEPSLEEQEEVVEYQFDLYIIIFPVLVFLMLLIVTFLMYKKSRTASPTTYDPNTDDELFLQITKEVLLVYARDHELFARAIQEFKNLFRSIDGDILIHDLNDNNQERAADPDWWIKGKIDDSNVAIIFFINKTGWLTYNNPNIIHRPERWQDRLFRNTVKQIKLSAVRNYTNLFVFETDVPPDGILCFNDINPGTRFCVTSIDTLLDAVFVNVEEPHLGEVQACVTSYNALLRENPNYVNEILVEIQ